MPACWSLAKYSSTLLYLIQLLVILLHPMCFFAFRQLISFTKDQDVSITSSDLRSLWNAELLHFFPKGNLPVLCLYYFYQMYLSFAESTWPGDQALHSKPETVLVKSNSSVQYLPIKDLNNLLIRNLLVIKSNFACYLQGADFLYSQISTLKSCRSRNHLLH